MTRAKPPELDAETERRLAAGLYNDVWRLMELPIRLPEQDDEDVLSGPGLDRRIQGAVVAGVHCGAAHADPGA